MIGYDSVKEQIRQQVDLVDFISRDVPLKRKGRDFAGLCPFHQEKTPSFYVSPDKGIFKCFGCGAGGDLFGYVQRRENVAFGEAVRLLADQCGIEIPRVGTGKSPDQPARHDLFRVNQWAADTFRKALLEGDQANEHTGQSARQYVADRGISREAEQAFGLGLAVEDGGWLLRSARSAGVSERLLMAAGLVRRDERGSAYGVFRNRLMFPIRDTMNRVLGFGGRTLGDDRSKYLNTAQNPVFDKRRLLYGMDQARARMAETGRAIVVEGYTDCIAAHQMGFSNTVATLGTALTDEHMGLLRRWCGEVVLVFDSDEAGQRAADRAVEVALRFDVVVRIARLSDDKDPCALLMRAGAGPFEDVLNRAVDALGFKWGLLCERFGGGASGGGRSDAVRAFVALAGQLVQRRAIDPIERGLIVNRLSRLMGLPAGEVNQLLNAAARKAADTPRGRSGGQGAPVVVAEAATRATSDGSAEPGGSMVPVDGTGDAEQAALEAILAALINEPGYFSIVDGVFDPQRFSDPGHRRVGQAVAELCRTVGEFRVAELLDRLEEPADGELVSDLVYRGASLGAFEETITGCKSRLEQIGLTRRVRQAADALRAAGEGNELERLAQISRDQVNRHGFGTSQGNATWSKHCAR